MNSYENKKRLKICMVSDFLYPSIGGVEEHIFNLSKFLNKKGHKVIIITRQYGERVGIRYLSIGVKVYYLPSVTISGVVSLPTFIGFLPIMRNIFIREKIDLVHTHGSCSTMTHEAIFIASLMKLPRCYTDHSLLGIDTIGGIFINKISKFTLSDICHTICVSHTSRENAVLRTLLDPIHVSTIPNAIISENFTPCPERRPKDIINIISASRLVERKGIGILKLVIPIICKNYSNVNFLIIGEGNKRVDLEQMCEKEQLQDRVTFYGVLDNSRMRDTLVQGHIFLNTSLTEAFCIAIVEAASCGLLVVSTAVGGIPEVLPPELMILAKPSVNSVCKALSKAISKVVKNQFENVNTSEVLKFYAWDSVSTRTEEVYYKCVEMEPSTFADQVYRYFGCGGILAGAIAVNILTLSMILLKILEFIYPEKHIEEAPTWSMDLKDQEATGDLKQD